MISRTLEPEVMDSREDAWDYDSMDHSEVNRRFVEDLLAAGLITRSSAESENQRRDGPSDATAGGNVSDDDAPPLLVLDLGTGTAQIPIHLCQATEDVR